MGRYMQGAQPVSMLGPSFPQCLTQISVNINRCCMSYIAMYFINIRATMVYLEQSNSNALALGKCLKVKSRKDLLRVDDSWSTVLQRDACLLIYRKAS